MANHDFDGAPAPLAWERIRAADRPFAPACERNKGPILDVLRRLFADATDVLEIGSGTGQHAVWFAAGLPHLTWRTSDLAGNHAGINAWIDEAGLESTHVVVSSFVHDGALPAPFCATLRAASMPGLPMPGIPANDPWGERSPWP